MNVSSQEIISNRYSENNNNGSTCFGQNRNGAEVRAVIRSTLSEDLVFVNKLFQSPRDIPSNISLTSLNITRTDLEMTRNINKTTAETSDTTETFKADKRNDVTGNSNSLNRAAVPLYGVDQGIFFVEINEHEITEYSEVAEMTSLPTTQCNFGFSPENNDHTIVEMSPASLPAMLSITMSSAMPSSTTTSSITTPSATSSSTTTSSATTSSTTTPSKTTSSTTTSSATTSLVPPTYKSLMKSILHDEPPKYEMVTGKTLQAELKCEGIELSNVESSRRSSVSTSGPPRTASKITYDQKLIFSVVMIGIGIIIFAFGAAAINAI